MTPLTPKKTALWAASAACLAGLCVDTAQAQATCSTTPSSILTNVKLDVTPPATGNGTTDDTVALQNAANNSRTLFFPEGTYLTDGLTLCPNTVVVAGRNAALKAKAAGGGHVLTLAPGSIVEGLAIDGNKANRNNGHCIWADGTPPGDDDFTIRSVHVRDCKEAGIVIHDADRFVIDGNRVDNTDKQGILVEGGPANPIRRGRISNNQVADCWNGIQWWGGDAAVSTSIGAFDLTISGTERVNDFETATSGFLM